MKRIVSHNPRWMHLYAAETEMLSMQLGPILISSHHIGSTAIPNLPAKPIIDILLEVTSNSRLDKHNDRFETHGYEPRGEYGIGGRRYFSKKPFGEKLGYHVHAYEAGNYQVQRHLAFRDFLLLKPEVAAEYADIKRKLSDIDGVLVPGYQESKKSWVDEMSLEAMRHYLGKS